MFAVFTILFVVISYNSAIGISTPLMESLKAGLLGLGGLGVVSTVTLSVFNSIEDRHMKIIENTYSHITRWDDPHLAAARKFTRRLKESKPHMSDTEFLKQVNDNEELRHSIVLVCNYFEQVRMSYMMNRIDIKLFNKCLGPVMRDYYERLKPYVASQGNDSLKDWEEIRNLSYKT